MVSLRSPVGDWSRLLVLAACQLALAGGSWTKPDRIEWAAWAWLCLGVVTLARALWVAQLRVDLKDDRVVFHGLRRRSVPLTEIRAMRPRRRFLTGPVVELVPVTGRPVAVRVLTSSLSHSGFDRDAEAVERWWLARDGSAEAARMAPSAERP
ncbi:MAG: hypothetical protein HGA44_17805 [Cellulomonadaceae bacterium]|nr:hypothetical protein [Cellulomonadaceae bacterium]